MKDQAKKFADAVGRDKMAQAFGVGPTAISNAIRRGRFPSAWYEIGQALAVISGTDCPPELFGQKSFHAAQNVNGGSDFQGAAE